MLLGGADSNIVLILDQKGRKNNLIRLSKDWTQGQTLNGKVLNMLSGRKALIDLNGEKLKIETKKNGEGLLILFRWLV
mgnify:CR=1 FL=1